MGTSAEIGRSWRLPLLLALYLLAQGGWAMADEDLEQSACGFFREPWSFWLFRQMAGDADALRLTGIEAIEDIAFITRDGRTLRGYRLRAQNPIGYLLVAGGNAMLADQIVGEFEPFRERGLDVYVYDYRGYGRSDGRSRLKALVSDYRELVNDVNGRGYGQRLLYGMSMGGIILLNAVGTTSDYDALVVDSSPSRIAPYGCPERYDPVNNLPVDASRLMIVLGGRDAIIPSRDIEELAQQAAHHGASILRDPAFAHPFQDMELEVHRRRLRQVADFLLDRTRP